MKHIQTFESFSELNEITFTDNQKVKNLLLRLKNKIKNTSVYGQVSAFINMEVLDVHSTYDNIIDHIRYTFPLLFGKGKEYEPILEALLAEGEFFRVDEDEKKRT